MRRRGGRAIRLFGLLIVLLALLWLGGLWHFAATIPTAVDDPGQQTDAIVVLTGGSLRVESGLALLAAGKGKKLFVSGVYRGVDVSDLLRLSRQTPDSVACCIALGHAADNTAGNARETAEWIAAENFHSLRLVTASYHMRRSLLEFSRAMPAIDIVPHPVFPASFAEHPWWWSRASAVLVVTEYDKYLYALARPYLPAALMPQGSPE